MEIRFENRYTRDEQTAKEIYKYWYFRRPIFIALYVILALYIPACIFGLMFDFEDAREFIAPVIMAIVAPVMMFVSYRSQVSTMVKRDREMAQGGEVVCEVSVSDEEFAVTSLGNRTAIKIYNAKKAYITTNYIVVLTAARLMVILKKDGFTLGDAESFISFLREKGIHILK